MMISIRATVTAGRDGYSTARLSLLSVAISVSILCPSFRSHISETTRPNFTKLHAVFGSGNVTANAMCYVLPVRG